MTLTDTEMMKTETEEKQPSIETMAFDELLSLRERLDALIAQRIGEEEKELEARLARIKRLKYLPGAIEDKVEKAAEGRRGKLPPRYRNPENPSQTWAGRGLKPRWLTQALRSGKKMSHFVITDADE